MGDMPALAQGALETLMAYPWPGNVRELENAVERALILSRGQTITFGDFQAPMKRSTAVEPGIAPYSERKDTLALDEIVSTHIRRVLEMTEGRVGGEGGAARLLRINPSTLRKRMRKLGIPFGRKA